MVLFNGMKETLVPIDQAGRIVLPQQVRKELGIKAGDRFRVGIDGIVVTLRPARQSVGLKRKGKALVYSSESGQKIDEETVSGILAESREEGFSRLLAGLRSTRRRA